MLYVYSLASVYTGSFESEESIRSLKPSGYTAAVSGDGWGL